MFSDTAALVPAIPQSPLLLDLLFDSSNHVMKSLVREIFSFQRQAIDGICAAALHVTQSKNFTTYYCKRKRRLVGKAE